ncbi:MAG: 2-oxo acid dehydrogenase subunit E2 [Rhodospirillales bacterium]|nr:MAG: 2-oxo acid dehydrogenase subunit E2 [Rhodospirillales bacterium]
MAKIFKLPDLGEGLKEAEIVAWHVGVGDHVVTDQPLVSVETDKAVVEVPAPHSGYIAALHGDAGDVVPVGAPLVEFADEAAADAGAIVGKVAIGEKARPAAPDGKASAAPAVRRLAAQLGVDLAAVKATGPDGTVTRADVEGAAGEAEAAEPIRGVRRAMFHNMTRAGREIVPATVTDEADIESWPAGTDVTVRLIRAVAVACRASPSLNAWFDAATMTRRVHQRIELGIAVETEDGLFAPVMRDIGNRDAADLRRGVEAMKKDIAARSIPPEQLVGQTITLSNFGMFGGRFADLVVVPPQVAILGAGRAEMRIVAVDGTPVAHRLLPLSLSFDHRVVTGVEAARFLNAAIEDLERPD